MSDVLELVRCKQCGTKCDVEYCIDGLCLYCQGRTCGQQKDIVVTINHSLDEYSIEFIQQIEKALDDALVKVGFTRSTSTKENKVEFVYWQFAMATKI